MQPQINQQFKELYKNFSPLLKQEKTQKFSSLTLTLITLSIFGIFAINPTITTIVHLQKQLEDSLYVEQKLQEKILSLSALQTKYALIREDIPTIFNALPQKPTVPLFAAQLQGSAQKSRVKIGRLQIFQVELSKKEKSQENASSFGFTLDAEGSRENLTTFLSSLISFERIVSIDSISLGNAKTKDAMQVSLRGKTYFKP